MFNHPHGGFMGLSLGRGVGAGRLVRICSKCSPLKGGNNLQGLLIFAMLILGLHIDHYQHMSPRQLSYVGERTMLKFTIVIDLHILQ